MYSRDSSPAHSSDDGILNSVQIFSGLVWRHVPHGANALHVGWILRATGRWNRQGIYGCLYTSLTREGALAEYRKYRTIAHADKHSSARDLVSVRVNRVGPVLDLTDAEVCAETNVDRRTLISSDPEDLETCRTIADWARSEGYQGLLVPSAAKADATNLVIYIDGPVRNVDIDEGSERQTIGDEIQ